jgi:DNA-binding beta-propeller fold protein YncE
MNEGKWHVLPLVNPCKTRQRRFSRTIAGMLLIMVPAVVGAEPISFKRDVAPVLLNNCLACHGPKKAEGGYRIDTFERLTAAGDSTQPGFAAKDVDGSEAFRRITSTDVKERMPLEGDPLPADQVALLKRWIEGGVPFDGPDPKAPLASYIPPPTHPAAPEKYRGTMPITAVEFSSDGSQLFVGGYHEITVWSPVDGKLVRRLPGVGQRTYAIHFSPDGQLLAVAAGTPGRHGEVRLFKPESGELVKVLGMTSDVVFDCAFSPQGDRLATAAADGVARIFDVASGSEQLAITSHSDWVFCVAWNADGTQLATGSRDKTAKVFDAKTGELLITYNGHNQPVRGVLFHPEGKEVYSAGSDNKLHRWNIAEGKKAAEAPLGGEGYKLTPASADAFFASSADNMTRQFGFKDQKPIREFSRVKDWVLSTAFCPTKKLIAGGSFDGQVYVWNAEDGAAVTSFYAAPGYEPPKK